MIGGEILGFMKDEQAAKAFARMFSLIEAKVEELEDDRDAES